MILSHFDPKASHIIAGGDWNLTQHSSDSSSQDHFASTPQSRTNLQSALDSLNLHEVYQPAHTCIRTGGTMASSRIDRFYISHSIPEKCLMLPEVTLPPHPYMPGSEEKTKGPTDHFPIHLSFSPANLSKRARFKIPEWIATHPTLIQNIQQKWATTRKKNHAAKCWLQFKKLIRTEAITLMATFRKKAITKASSLTLGISIFRGYI